MKAGSFRKTAYGWLIGLAAALVVVCAIVRCVAVPPVMAVHTVTVKPVKVTETVTCAGTVTTKEGVEITASVPCVVGDVAVKVGDAVKQGDVLVTIDRAATLDKAVSVGISGASTAQYETVIPETVVSPTDGIVSAVHAAKGEMLSKDSPCVVLSRQGDVEIAVVFYESMMPRVKEGQAVTVRGAAFDKPSYSGTLTHIASSARSRVGATTSETVIDGTVSLSPDQIDESLLIGLTAKATVTVDTREAVLLVPYESVHTDEQGQSSVYIVQGETAYRRAVTVGESYADGVEIVSGVEAGQEIVHDASALKGDAVPVEVRL